MSAETEVRASDVYVRGHFDLAAGFFSLRVGLRLFKLKAPWHARMWSDQFVLRAFGWRFSIVHLARPTLPMGAAS